MNKNKKRLSRLVTIISLGVFIFAAYGLFDIFFGYYQNHKVNKEVRESFHTTTLADKQVSPRKTNAIPVIHSKFNKLIEQNPDVVGWISIDDTKIDYPILKSEDNYDYLTQDFNKNESIGGSIFLDYRNEVLSLDRNTVIYGHRMKDGSMFQHLTKFMEEDFFKSHQTFEIETLYDDYEAEIFAVYNTTTDFNYIETNFANDDEFEDLLISIQNESIYETNVKVNKDDQILTLSTCDYEIDENEGRLVVQAKLVKK